MAPTLHRLTRTHLLTMSTASGTCQRAKLQSKYSMGRYDAIMRYGRILHLHAHHLGRPLPLHVRPGPARTLVRSIRDDAALAASIYAYTFLLVSLVHSFGRGKGRARPTFADVGAAVASTWLSNRKIVCSTRPQRLPDASRRLGCEDKAAPQAPQAPPRPHKPTAKRRLPTHRHPCKPQDKQWTTQPGW